MFDRVLNTPLGHNLFEIEDAVFDAHDLFVMIPSSAIKISLN